MNSSQEIIKIPYLEVFNEENWAKHLPKKYLIKSHTFQIDQSDTEFLIDDCTNPDYTNFKINEAVNETIKNELNGQAFLKVYGRTAKDINHTMGKILSSHDLTMAIKMSQFLTEAFDQELQDKKSDFNQNSSKQIRLKFTLREYKEYLESPSNQFRLYFLKDYLVAISQKVPNHISLPANQLQIIKAKEIGKAVYSAIQKLLQKQESETSDIIIFPQYVVDCFIYESGSKGKIFSIEPIKPLHCLSLFSEEELFKLFEQAKINLNQNKPIKPEIKYVKNAQEFKEVDLSYYRVGWELTEGDALEEWKQFIKEK